MNCPKCDADITDSYQPAEPDVGISSGGWYCGDCDVGVDDTGEREPLPGDVPISFTSDKPRGTPLSELSGRPGHKGYERFKQIAESWGYP